MTPPDDAPASPELPFATDDWPTHPELVRHETRNLLVLAVQQIIFRIGWIFKTESIIMPAFLDAVSGAGWLRGCLPVINRFGQSIPPVLWADHLRASKRKKWVLFALIAAMSVPFGVLAAVWWSCPNMRGAWMAALFMALYLFFFLFAGLYRMAFGTLQGKLIRPTRRGQLLWMSTLFGTLPAIGFAVWLMPDWLRPDVPRFGLFFAFVAAGLFISGLSVLLACEPSDNDGQPARKATAGFSDAIHVLRADANLRRLVLVVMLANMSIAIFPHYQSLAREKLNLAGTHMVSWLVAQNLSIGVFSVLIGRLADRRGYRLTLQLLIVCAAIGPAIALGLTQLAEPLGAKLFWCVFIALGVVPLGLRATMNYTLEICEPSQHARYLSTVNVCSAVPFLFSPVVGWLIDVVGYYWVFSGIIAVILCGAVLSLTLKEPRHRLLPEEAVTLNVETDE